MKQMESYETLVKIPKHGRILENVKRLWNRLYNIA